MGSPLVFVADVTVDSHVRVGANFHVHLKGPLTIGAIPVAPEGTAAQLFITGKTTGKDGVTHYDIAITQFRLRDIGTLPVRPVESTVDEIKAGMDIPVTTMGMIAATEGRLRISIPLPINLSNDAPQGGYTASPIKTASPMVPPRRVGRPTPTPTPFPTPSPDPTAS